MLEKSKIYETEIVDYTSEGQGIAKVEGCAVFVPNAIVGEVCRIRIEKAAKTRAAGKIVEILARSPHRINRACPVAKLCGGCAFHHMDYEEETRMKAERVRSCLNRIGGENLGEVPILGVPGAAIKLPTTVFDVLLPQIFSGLPITKEELTGLGDGGLCQLCGECHWPNCSFGRY